MLSDRVLIQVGGYPLVPGAVVRMNGYRGDQQPRRGQVEKVKGDLVTVKCLNRSGPEGDVFRSYHLAQCNGLQVEN